jgi:CRP/FNR family transcriptional activator FtrB
MQIKPLKNNGHLTFIKNFGRVGSASPTDAASSADAARPDAYVIPTATRRARQSQTGTPSMKPGLATLRAVPMFEPLSADLLGRINDITALVEVAPGTELCRQGVIPDRLHILLDGQVALSGTAPDGTSAVVEVVHPIAHFVLAAVLTELAYQMTANAVTPSRLLLLDAAALRALLEQAPSLALALLRAEAQDFRAMVRQVRDLKLRSAAQRLGCYLLALVADPAAQTADLRLPFDKGLLAARLGCRQENLSRAFAALRAHGVETHGARVLLHDIARLRKFAVPDDLADPLVATAPRP